MTGVAVATSSRLAASAAREVAEAGGNAVDCAVAAALLTTNTEPGVCALAGGAYVTVWMPGAEPVTIDGNVAVPGLGRPAFGGDTAIETVSMDYGGGIETLVGASSVAVPGSLAAMELACRRYGRADWPSIVQPSVRAASEGFPISTACHHYLQYSGEPVFSRSSDGFNALHDEHGKLRPQGSIIRVPHLADTLSAIAHEGGEIFYRGDIGRRIAEHVQQHGGLLTREDLLAYEPLVRRALRSKIGRWSIATNPPPAVGGAVLSAMMLGFSGKSYARWSTPALQRLIDVQHAVLGHRADVLDLSPDLPRDIRSMLKLARSGQLAGGHASASTVHTSAVDGDGVACAVTASSGYGSGEMPAGTGLWLNNCLGELELNRRGLLAGPPGSRLASNMAPTAARNGQQVLAAGSPGADRITTALHQFLTSFAMMKMTLQDAIDHPRLHLEVRGPEPVIAFEPGLDLPDTSLRLRAFPDKGMYFGGVGAALFDPASGFEVAADPRRAGGTCICGGN